MKEVVVEEVGVVAAAEGAGAVEAQKKRGQEGEVEAQVES